MARFLAFLAWPLIEIALFVVIGGEIGLLATLLWIFATGVFGVWLLRRQIALGAVMMRQGGQGVSMAEGSPISGLFTALAAVLLILPGFLTDALAVLILLPPVQKLLGAVVLSRVSVMAAPGAGFGFDGFSAARGASRSTARDEVIDGEWVEVPPQAARRIRPSGWVEGGEDKP